MSCPSCGEPNRPDRLYCARCGAWLGAACAACGARSEAGDQFCGRCGAALGSGDGLETGGRTAFAGGRYQVQRVLGQGAHKRVYLATDLRLDREVALAVIRTDGLDEVAAARVHAEARAMARLGDHPHVVTVFDVGDVDGQPYIVSQYMAGGSVADLLHASAPQRLPLDDVLRIARQVANALAHAHARGVIHRDVKPSNVWLTADGVAKLGDFGLALRRSSSSFSRDGLLVGTVAYLPPEQALGRTVDARSDLYALGAMLYELVTGRPPFPGDDAVAVVSQHLNTPPVAPSWHNAGVPRALEALILRLLAKAPAERPASAAVVEEALAAVTAAPTAAAAPVPEAPHPLDRLAGGVFVGRVRESEELRGAVEDARAGRGRLVLLTGEPGIGKTRTAGELATYAGLRGCQVLWGRCHESGGAPAYWPWVQILRACLAERDAASLRTALGAGAADIAQVVPEVREHFPDLPPPAATEPEQARFRFFDRMTTFFRAAAGSRPLVLILDDVHWADKPSLLLLQFLAREMDDARVLVVATYRDQDYGREHPLADALGDLARAAVTRRVALTGLCEAEVARYIEMTAGVVPPPAVVGTVHRETEGNPFFLGEVVRLLSAEGRLAGVDAREGWGVPVPQGVRAVIARRLAGLSAACNQALAVASAIGREFGVDVLAQVSDLPAAQLTAALEEAVRARVLATVARPVGHYRFAHALLRETVYDDLGATRRTDLHRRLGDVLERVYGAARESHLAELAHHFSAAGPVGDTGKAIDYARRAGDRAVRGLAYEEGARLYEMALAALERAPAADMGLRGELTLALGEACAHAGESDRARELCRHAAELARATGAADQLARAALGYRTWWVTGLVDAFQVGLLEEALRALPRADSVLRTRVLARLAAELAFAPNDSRRDALSRDALAMARRLGDPATLAYALNCRHLAAWGPDDLEDRLALATEMVRLAERVGDRDLEARGRHLRVTNLLELGDREALDAEIAAHARLADELRQPLYRWQKTYFAAMQAALAGRFDESEALAEEALGIGQQKDFDAEQTYGVQMLRVREAQGRLGELQPFVQAFVAQSPAALGWRSTLALIESALGHREEAAREFEALAADDFAGVPQDLLWFINLSNLCGACVFLGDTRRAAVLYRLLAPYACHNVVVGGAVACQKSTSYLLGVLAATMERWDEAAAHFEDALALARRLQAPPFVAETEIPHARVLLERGHPGDAERALALLNHALGIAQESGMQALVAAGVAVKLRLQGVDTAAVQTSIDTVVTAVGQERPNLRPHAAPDGTVTILFSDIDGFAAMARRLGMAGADAVLRAHGRIIREHVALQGGLEVKSHGDGFMVVFASARRAVLCAIAIQRALAGYSAQHPEEPVRARVGLHTGEVDGASDDFFGQTVMLAARVASEAHGGEILVSAVVRELVAVTGDLPFGDGRVVDLAGVPGVPRVFEVPWAGAPAGDARPERARNVFRAEGEYWTLAYDGTVCRLRDAKGLHHIAYLLRHPGQQFDARVLVAPAGDPLGGATVTGQGVVVDLVGDVLALGGSEDAGPLLDTQARVAYRRRLVDLREEMAEAERFNDAGRVERLRDEIEMLSAQLAAAVGLGGRSRKAASVTERARLTVTKRIKDALGKVRDSHPALGEHLAARIRTGYQCAYLPEPERPIAWDL